MFLAILTFHQVEESEAQGITSRDEENRLLLIKPELFPPKRQEQYERDLALAVAIIRQEMSEA